MRYATLIILSIVLFTDIGYKITKGSDSLISWEDLCVTVLLIFVAVGEKIKELIINRSGITIKQKTENQISQFKQDAKDIVAVSEQGQIDRVDKLIERTVGENRDVWTKLVVFRMIMRILLRQICKAQGMQLKNTTAFVTMLRFLKDKNKIDLMLQKDIELVRDVTFFFEWGTGAPPTTEKIHNALDIAPTVLKSLEQIAKNKNFNIKHRTKA